MGFNKRGIIGFVLTMAVGAALGAAALVVSNEVNKEKKASKKSVSRHISNAIITQTNVKKAFSKYEIAFNNYKNAVAQGRNDINLYAEKLRVAKQNLADTMKSTSHEKEKPLEPSETYTDPVANNMFNPFARKNIKINNTSILKENIPDTNNEISARNTHSSATITTGNSDEINNESISNDNTDGSNYLSSLKYYRVKKGDSLSKICEKYYGDSGMWTHILKYQIPSIAATPNLIFPGQLIALPRQATGFKAWVNRGKQNLSNWKSRLINKIRHKNDTAPIADESWQNGFKPDYIVSDHTLTDYNALTAAQIQKFLEYKGSVLAKPYRGSSPAQMIYNAAKKYGISPKVLLTRLQCEQGLISAKTASKKKLDWALGVGCYDSGNWNQKYKGFDKQIEYAASTYRRHYDNATKMLKAGRTLNMRIDKKNIRVRNAASYAFYKYCPHFAGNKLFIDVWNGYKKYW